MTVPSEAADFRGRMQKLETLLKEIETFHDPAGRATAVEAIQTLMEFHGAAIAKMMELVESLNRSGSSLLNKFTGDDLVSSLLLLYGLHPDDLETRIRQAVEKMKPALRSFGATATLLGVADGVARISVERSGHQCGSTAGKIRAAIEEAIFDRAPEVTGIEIEGLSPPPASGGFVPVEQLLGRRAGATSIGVTSINTGAEHDPQTAAASGSR